nr:uncharacterized protein LOC113698698 isoform X4 [Coffea arabica]
MCLFGDVTFIRGIGASKGWLWSKGMVKYSGHTLISSLTPFCCVLKNHGRLSSSLFYGSSTKSRVYHYCKRSHLHTETIMVSLRYHPSWFSVAPMMDWTDNHFRTLARLISKHAWLYTEMIAAETIVFQKGDLNRFLAYGPEQHPIVLQIGGSNLDNLAKATQLADPYGYDEINFNCGCPSPRVAGHGCFGVRLMLDPKFVAEAMSVIAANTDVPVSVKCRIGVDDHDSYYELCDFIYKVSSQSPTRHFIIHSRKALLNGLTPAENRKIPPLKYEYYYALLRDFPDLQFTINGDYEVMVHGNFIEATSGDLVKYDSNETNNIDNNRLELNSLFITNGDDILLLKFCLGKCSKNRRCSWCYAWTCSL